MKPLKGSPNLSAVFLAFTLLLTLSPEAKGVTVGEITQALTCTCGCNMVVGACEGAMECSAAKSITEEVTQLVSQGKSKDELIRYFVERNGERILAAPTKEGFNLTAWILPFFLIILGGGLLYMFLTRCVIHKGTKGDREKNKADIAPVDKEYLDRIESELKEYDS